jgi:hypothetical protein
MSDLHPSDDPEARLQRRLNWALPIASLAAACAAGAYFFLPAGTGEQSRMTVMPPPLRDLGTAAATPAQPYRLSEAGTLLRPDGSAAANSASLTGYVDTVSVQGAEVSLRGWAFDHASKTPAALVLVLVDGIAVVQGKPGSLRGDVATALKVPAAERSGYTIRFTLPPDANGADMVLRVFALDKSDAARELIYPLNFPFGPR